MLRDRIPHLLLGLYLLVFAVCAISPYSREVWLAENIPMWLIVGGLVILYRWHRFSNLAYLLMTVLPILHTIGGHYTFERVPFDFVSGLFGFERNHFDRLAHFTVGFYAFAMAEWLMVRRLVTTRWLIFLFPLFAIFTVAAVYEVIEWQYAVYADPAAGGAVLGSQGDAWDAQKDMLADASGALLVLMLFAWRYRKQLREFHHV